MEFDEAKHLLSRTSFSANTDGITQLLALSRQEAVERVIYQVSSQNKLQLPSWIYELPPLSKFRTSLSDSEKKAFRKKIRRRGLELKIWWFKMFTQTSTPFIENMTLDQKDF